MRFARLALYACFFLSGASALIYEVVWQRMLTLGFGVTTWSVTVVLTAYMAGLALGAWLFGPPADRVKRPARLYGLLELLIAASAWAVSYCLDPLMGFYVRLAQTLDPGSTVTQLIRLVLALATLLVPCTLIGGTAPLMGRLVARWSGTVGVAFGRFYAVNTLGAVAGAGLAGFLLLRQFGMQAAGFVALGGNILAGLIALTLSFRDEGHGAASALTFPSHPNVRAPARDGALIPIRAVLLLAGLGGLTGLGYEVAWARLLAVYTLNSVYVFTMLLTVYLAGLALGSGIAAHVLRRRRVDSWLTLAFVQGILALTGPLVLLYTGRAADLGFEYQVRPAGAIFWIEYQIVVTVVLVPSLLLGMTLPLLAELVRGKATGDGRQVGRIYAANTVGAVMGTALTGLLLIPGCGLRTTVMLLTLVNFAIGCYAAQKAETASGRTRRWFAPLGAVLLVAVALLMPYGTQFIRPATLDDGAILYYAEGRNAIVHVTQSADPGSRFDRVLYVDSQSVAGTSDEIVTDQKMLAHLPLLLHPEPRRVLTVGFGSGGTAYSMLLHNVETHCVEIERAVPAAARFFTPQNGGAVGLPTGPQMGRTNFRLILDDARSWLHLAREPYDVIVGDLTSIQYRGNGNLYTAECFELMKRRLTPEGVACAWVPLTGIETEPLRIVVRTFRSVFPNTSIWYMYNLVNDFIILVGTPGRLEIDLTRWQAVMNEPFIAADLEQVGLFNIYKLGWCLLVAQADVEAFCGPGPLHTDDRPILDYLTHAGVYRDTLAENLRALVERRSDPRDFVAAPPAGVSSEAFEDAWERWRQASNLLIAGHILQRSSDQTAAVDAYRRAAQLVPEDPFVVRLGGGP